MPDMIKIRPLSITWALSMTALLLVIANCFSLTAKAIGHDYVGGLVPMFDMDQEKNLPTFFSTFLAVLASALLLAIALVRKKSLRSWKLWAGLSAVFLFIAMDDFIAIHEHLSRPMRDLFDAQGLLFFAWIIPYGVFVMVLAGVYGRFVFEMPVHIRNGMLLAATFFLVGAIGFEMLGGKLFEYSGMSKTTIYGVISMGEESLELAGMIVFIHALLRYIEDVQKNILLQVGLHDPLEEIVRVADVAHRSVYGVGRR